ncbi:MAG: hypothetical protein N2746_06065 [Deltaproteobacteria bacterium]|nr:hypothetical protein [Deltaproteobacteria bacterium]
MKMSEEIYSAEVLNRQDRDVLVYQDRSAYKECEGIAPIVSYFFILLAIRGFARD